MLLNVEGDEVAYRCAFASEKQGYIWHGKNKSVDLGTRFTATQIKEINIIKYNRVFDEDYTLESYKVIETQEEVMLRLDNMLNELFVLTLPKELKKQKIDSMDLWLSPSDHSNFRYKVADISGPNGFGYKTGRQEKPVHLKFIRDLMINKYHAQEISGYEADDALGMYQTNNTVACHIDKDINMIPGWHLDWVNQEFYHVPDGLGEIRYNDKKKLKGDGLIFFYAQMLMGDRTDNIPGIKGMGDIGAGKILQTCQTELECFRVIQNAYALQYKENYKQALIEIADLIWICRNPEETGGEYILSKGFI